MTANAVSQREEVASPCTNVCKMTPDTGLCEGCFRTLDEIAAWSALTNDEKRWVLAQLPGRKPKP